MQINWLRFKTIEFLGYAYAQRVNILRNSHAAIVFPSDWTYYNSGSFPKPGFDVPLQAVQRQGWWWLYTFSPRQHRDSVARHISRAPQWENGYCRSVQGEWEREWGTVLQQVNPVWARGRRCRPSALVQRFCRASSSSVCHVKFGPKKQSLPTEQIFQKLPEIIGLPLKYFFHLDQAM